MKKLYLLTIAFVMLPLLSHAVSCLQMPSCSELGYYKGYNEACGTDETRYIKCPYDTSYRKCVNYECSKIGFTKVDKSSWCKEVVKCKLDEQYSLCAEPK